VGRTFLSDTFDFARKAHDSEQERDQGASRAPFLMADG